MDITLIQTIWTVVALSIFISITLWAWSSARKQDFQEAANLPLEGDVLNVDPTKEREHV